MSESMGLFAKVAEVNFIGEGNPFSGFFYMAIGMEESTPQEWLEASINNRFSLSLT